MGIRNVLRMFDVVMDLILGYNTYRVPETIRVSLTGEFPAGVMARDLMHKVARDIDQDGAIDKVIEFQGPTVQKMAIDTRMTLCNMTRKVEAIAGIVAADRITEKFFNDRGIRDIELVSSDEDLSDLAQESIRPKANTKMVGKKRDFSFFIV